MHWWLQLILMWWALLSRSLKRWYFPGNSLSDSFFFYHARFCAIRNNRLIFFTLCNGAKVLAEAYSKPCQTSKVELFGKIVNGFLQLTIFTKSFVYVAWQDFEYTFGYDALFAAFITFWRDWKFLWTKTFFESFIYFTATGEICTSFFY